MRDTIAFVWLLLVLPIHALAGQSTLAADTVPKATGGQMVAQTLLGGAGGLVGSIGLAYLGSQSGTDAGTDDPGLTGAIIGFSLGALIGYHASARSTHQRLKAAALERVRLGVAPMGRDQVGLLLRIEF